MSSGPHLLACFIKEYKLNKSQIHHNATKSMISHFQLRIYTYTMVAS